MLRQIIFDWSGVLADDMGPAFRATNETLRHFGAAEIDLTAFRRDFRVPVEEFYRSRLPYVPIREVDQFFFELYAAALHEIRLFPGILPVCQLARAMGMRLLIFSTAETQAIDAALNREGIHDLFEEVAGNAVNKVEALPALLRRLRLAPDETIFIGDMPHDLAAGRAAGTLRGASLYGYSLPQALESEGAEEYFAAPQAIFDWLFTRLAGERIRRPVATVGGLVFNGSGEILLIRTRKWSGLFGTPGGKIEYGERAADAFVREVKEETGLDVTDVEYVSLDEGIESPEFERPAHFLFLNFRGRAIFEDVQLNHEAQEWGWADPREALTLPLNQPTRALIERALDT